MYGENIRKYRKLCGKTQEDVAMYLGVAPQTIYKYEKEINEPDTKTLAKLADYFNVTVDELLGRTINEPIVIAASTKEHIDIADLPDSAKEFIKDIISKYKNLED